MHQKRYSPACERNRDPILQKLTEHFDSASRVLEIGSGTGQHAVYFARHLHHLFWQTSDRPEAHSSILAWIEESELDNIGAPIELDVSGQWPNARFDAAFTANTCHIMSWDEVNMMFRGVSLCLDEDGIFVVYGPFNYNGRYTSQSNEAFDISLRNQAPHMGLRNQELIVKLAVETGFVLLLDQEMPANNRLLLFQKTTKANIAAKSD